MMSLCQKNHTCFEESVCGLARLFFLVVATVTGRAAQAGVMTKETLLQAFSSPIILDDKNAELQI